MYSKKEFDGLLEFARQGASLTEIWKRILSSISLQSFWKEQFGHAIIEAMACETPVIGSDSAEVPNVIREAGIITPEGDADSLREAIAHMAASPELRQQLGKAGRAHVSAKYTHQEIARQLVEFFKSL